MGDLVQESRVQCMMHQQRVQQLHFKVKTMQWFGLKTSLEHKKSMICHKIDISDSTKLIKQQIEFVSLKYLPKSTLNQINKNEKCKIVTKLTKAPWDLNKSLL